MCPLSSIRDSILTALIFNVCAEIVVARLAVMRKAEDKGDDQVLAGLSPNKMEPRRMRLAPSSTAIL